MKVTSCRRPRRRHSREKALLRRSFFVHGRTDHDSPLTPLNANRRLNETLAYLTHLEATGRAERLPGEPEHWRSTIA